MILINLIHNNFVFSQLSREDYIAKYSKHAVEEMSRTKIPASITLAQALLESDNGNSDLAKEANNHFGIKCHGWEGGKIYKDDDTKNECFRKYKSVLESYKDHSEFIRNSKRYSSLFTLEITDYSAWAKGLKDAGYATNPKYPEMLVKIIEDNKLYEFDNSVKFDKNAKPLADIDNPVYVGHIGYEVFLKNKIKCIKVKSGDTFYKIASEMDMNVWQLYKYNDFEKDYKPQSGEIIYIQPKRSKAEKKYETHTVSVNETIHSISQLYGIKIKSLSKLNNLKPDSKITEGTILNLQKRKSE